MSKTRFHCLPCEEWFLILYYLQKEEEKFRFSNLCYKFLPLTADNTKTCCKAEDSNILSNVYLLKLLSFNAQMLTAISVFHRTQRWKDNLIFKRKLALTGNF